MPALRAPILRVKRHSSLQVLKASPCRAMSTAQRLLYTHTHTEAVRTRRFLLLPRAKVAKGQRIFVARCSRKALKSRRRSADLCSEMQPESFACKTQYRNSCFNCSPKASQMHLTSELSFWGQAPKILQLPPQPLALRAQAW